MIDAVDIHVKGIVQGVGFRPFVYRMAKKYLINGWVLNAADGVYIHAEGESKLVDEFIMELSDNPPAASTRRGDRHQGSAPGGLRQLRDPLFRR